jgi:AraC-like DNA-binding protein
MNEYYTKGDTLFLIEQSEIIIQKCVVNESTEYHRHRFIEIAYVDAGNGTHEIVDGPVLPVEKGDLIMFNPGVAHRFQVTPPGSLTVYNCLFDPSVLDASVSRSDDFINIVYDFIFETSVARRDPKPYIFLNNAESAAEIVKEMFREYTSKQNGYTKVNAANLMRLLIAIFRLKRSDGASGVDAYKAAIADSAIRYIRTYYADNVPCSLLAARAFVSTGYFHKVFKEVCGVTPTEYVQSVRLSEASKMLLETTLPVSSVAGAVGYSDVKFFYELFRRRFGVSPGEYRKNAGSGEA